MTYLVTYAFEVNGRYYGEGTGTFVPRFDGCRAEHAAYICPTCGEVWARVIALSERRARHFAIHRACVLHKGVDGSMSIPGSIWPIIHEFPVGAIPLELLKEEFLLHYERSFPNASAAA